MNVQEELLHYPWCRRWHWRHGQNVKSFTLKVPEVIGKGLSWELSCTRTGLALIWSSRTPDIAIKVVALPILKE